MVTSLRPRWLKKTAQGLQPEDTNPQQDLRWTGAAAKCGGESGAGPPLARETGYRKATMQAGPCPSVEVLQGSESSLWLQSGEAVKVETLGDCVP